MYFCPGRISHSCRMMDVSVCCRLCVRWRRSTCHRMESMLVVWVHWLMRLLSINNCASSISATTRSRFTALCLWQRSVAFVCLSYNLAVSVVMQRQTGRHGIKGDGRLGWDGMATDNWSLSNYAPESWLWVRLECWLQVTVCLMSNCDLQTETRQRPVSQCRQFPEEAKDASVSECTWTLSALEVLHNALYKFKT